MPNAVEAIKSAKNGLDIWKDIEGWARTGYASIPDDQFELFKWYGLYRQRPNVGHFMIRIRVPGGGLSARQAREVAALSREFGRGTQYKWYFDGEWHCAEYHIDASNQSYAFYLDGTEELAFENGEGEYSGTDIPDSFDTVRIGWINYQESPPGFTAWIDDVAFDDERIGCH